MKFPGPGACLATVYLRFQATNDSSETRATGASTALLGNSGDLPPHQHILGAPLAFLPNILCNKYKGPNYPARHPWTTLDTDNVDQPPSPLDLEALDIKIISLAPFAHIIQDGTSAFQLYISLALPERTSRCRCHYSRTKEYNASDYAIVSILLQMDSGSDKLWPVTFYTRSMIPVGLNYNIYDKELLALTWRLDVYSKKSFKAECHAFNH
ncbi:hypothetical protein C0993_011744 [Termitomyces sp. T159_Od127]|nr:hypothetical protein C0993_011744 [Termitomyces sp. T159_Od127]